MSERKRIEEYENRIARPYLLLVEQTAIERNRRAKRKAFFRKLAAWCFMIAALILLMKAMVEIWKGGLL